MMEKSNPFFWGLFLLPTVWGLASSVLDFRYAAALAALGCISLGVSLSMPPMKRSLSGRKGRTAGRRAGHDHVLFEPVPLSGPVVVKHRKRENRAVIILVTVFSLLLLFVSGPGEQLLPAGIPAAEASALSWDFESLSRMDENSEFPGVSAYFRHKAYQDSFMYGGDYSLPQPGSTLSVDEFVIKDGTILNRPRIVFSFDGEWFRSSLADMAGSGPGRLMSSEEFIPSIERKNSYFFGNSIGILLIAGLCLLLNFYIRIFGMHPDRLVRSDRFSGKFVFRRKQQAA